MSDEKKAARFEFSVTVLFLSILAGVIAGGAVTLLSPVKYRSSATLQIRSGSSATAVDLSKERRTILSKDVLFPVVENLNLAKEWSLDSRDAAFFRLRSAITLREIRNTDLVQLRVFSTDPKLSAEVANAVAAEYQRKRILEQRAEIDQSLAQLNEQVQAMRLKAEKPRRELESIRVELGVSESNSELVPERYRKAKERYIQEKKILEAAELRLATESMQQRMPQAPVTIWERAEPSRHPVAPNLILNVLLGAQMGAMAGFILMFARSK